MNIYYFGVTMFSFFFLFVDDTITNEIRSFLACILPQLKEGIEDCDIPSLDPLQINELKLNNVGG